MAHTYTLTDPRSCAVGVSGASVLQAGCVAPWSGNRGGWCLPGLHHPPYPPPKKLRTPGGGKPTEEGAGCTFLHQVGGESSKNTPDLRKQGVLRRCNSIFGAANLPIRNFAKSASWGCFSASWGCFSACLFLVHCLSLSQFLFFIEREREGEAKNGIRKSHAKSRKSKNHVTGSIRRLHTHPQVNLRMIGDKKSIFFNGLPLAGGASADPQREMPPSPPRGLFFGVVADGC